MLVSLAVFSILVTVLLTGFYQGLAAWERGSKNEQIWQTLLFRQQWLRTLFSQAVLANYRKSKEEMYVPYFQGTPSRMEFITAAPLLDNPGHVRPVMLKFQRETNNQGITLYYLEGALHSDPDRALHWNNSWIPLLQHLKQGSFSYEAFAFPVPDMLDVNTLSEYAKPRYRNQTEWLANYDIQQLWLYPRRVKINFIDEHNRPHQWQFFFTTLSDVNNLGFIEDDEWF